MRAPLALCGQSVLAAASLAAQRHADVEIDGRLIPISLWAISIAESGERKTAVDKIALAPHIEYERTEIDRRAADHHAHRVALMAYEASVARAKRGGRGATQASIREAIAACGDAPPPPPSGILITREPTLEAVQRLYLTGIPALGLFVDEGAVWLGGHSMSEENRLRTIGALSTLWDRGMSDRIRVGEGAHKIYDRRLALHLLIQPVVAEQVLSDKLLAGQGFLARALITWPETTAGTREYREVDASKTPALRAYHTRMHALLTLPIRERAGHPGELAPDQLKLEPPAKRAWIMAYDEIERAMAPGEAYAQIRPWASKGAEQLLRIAGVLSLVDEPNGQIGLAAIEAATVLVRYYLGEAVRLIDTAAIPVAIRHAEAILKWANERGRDMVDARTLLRLGPNCVRHRAELDDAMAVLERAGWAELHQDVELAGRRVRRAWQIRSVRVDEGPS